MEPMWFLSLWTRAAGTCWRAVRATSAAAMASCIAARGCGPIRSPMRLLARIAAPHFVAGIVLRNDLVVEAAPIVIYMQRQKWSRDKVREFCRKNGWQVEVVKMEREDTQP